MSRSDSPLLSVPARRLEVAAAVDVDFELKFDWEDYEVLSGERPLVELLEDAAVDPDRIRSVHLPPGVRTRGRAIGMAATEGNLGTITDFVHAQLDELPDVLLVMHPPRRFDYGDQLSLLATLCDLTGHEISIENPPDESFWHTPEDVAFFGYVGATYDAWSDLYLTVDGAHLPPARSPPGEVDEDALEELFDRLRGISTLDLDAVRDGFRGYLDGNVSRHRSLTADCPPGDGWTPLLNALALAGDRVRAVHFNDPIEDGVPEVEGHRDNPTLEAVRAVVRSANVHLVLEPDREAFDRPAELARRVESVEAWLAGGRD